MVELIGNVYVNMKEEMCKTIGLITLKIIYHDYFCNNSSL